MGRENGIKRRRPFSLHTNRCVGQQQRIRRVVRLKKTRVCVGYAEAFVESGFDGIFYMFS